jgi:spore coat polysaccharide biosynthesis predicted glycosyltransferase SpsG
VNGSFFIPEKSKLNYIVGPSLRYKKVFDTKINRKMQRDFLVLLPYAQQEEENIFRVLYDVNFGENNIIIKTHPANKHIRCRQYICSNYKIIDSDLYDLFKNTKIAVGAASGSLLEAASVGIPVIMIKSPDSLDYDILPEHGKGLVWEEAVDTRSLQRAIQMIEQRLNNEIDAIDRISKDYREMFFLEPNESNIIRVFDLN